jgi:hypothetical protein
MSTRPRRLPSPDPESQPLPLPLPPRPRPQPQPQTAPPPRPVSPYDEVVLTPIIDLSGYKAKWKILVLPGVALVFCWIAALVAPAVGAGGWFGLLAAVASMYMLWAVNQALKDTVPVANATADDDSEEDDSEEGEANV